MEEEEEGRVFAPPRQKLKLTAYVFKYPRQFWVQALGGLIYNTVIVFGAIFLGRTIDAANLVYQGEAQLSLFYANLFAFLGFTVLFQLARYFKRFYMRQLLNLMKGDMRAGLLASLLQTPMTGLSKEKVGDMMSRMIGDVDQVGRSVQKTVTEMWDTAVLMLAYFAACLFYSPKITLLAAIPIPIALLLAELLRHRLYHLAKKARKAASRINVHLQHNVSGVALLRLFGLEETDRNKFSRLLDKQLKLNVAAAALQNGMLPLYILTACSGVVLVVGMGGANVVGGLWSIGVFTAYLTMFMAMAARTHKAAEVMNTWHGAKASWERICEKLAVGGYEAEATAPLPATPNAAALQVRSLSFTYPFGDEPCLQDVSFCAGKGEIVGVTGPVGSGKSALAAALSGLFPYDGEVLVGGRHLYSLKGAERQKIAYMDAEHFIFSDDVDFNVALGREGDLDEALELAAMTEDAAGFEQGTRTRLMERGLRLSGGQRQRVALARAWFGNAEILLLDDPFSAVDVHMERRIMENMRKKLGGRTVLLFSHRLAAFEMTDKVLVMERGRVAQQGTHEELLAQDGVYRDIYLAQKFLRGKETSRSPLMVGLPPQAATPP
ncbi:MAG: ABC transporter ATP-binding protein/permease [Clostridiales bacterium]|nr:ABC transporter ATP-binding protein/permease [Clostridiales bacterium]